MHEYLFAEIALLEHDSNVVDCDKKRQGSGTDYEQDFLETIEKICSRPAMYKISYKPDKRILSLSRYPYRILYRVVGNEVHILAVGHRNKRPEYWEERASSF